MNGTSICTNVFEEQKIIVKRFIKIKTYRMTLGLRNLAYPVKLRLCLFRVSDFPENTYFPKMLFSGKENSFKCLVVF